jgi:CBS domain-containing protein
MPRRHFLASLLVTVPIVLTQSSFEEDRKSALDFRLNLETETIGQVYSADPLCVEPTAGLRDVFELLRARNRGSVLVCESGKLVGIFTERDALRLMAAGDNLERSMADVMVRDPVCVRVGESVASAIQKMSIGGYRRLPVVDELDCPLGVLNVSGILHYFVEHFPSVIYNLPPEPHHAMQEREGA